MDDWMVVICLSLAMLVGCYLAGCIPLAFSFSEDKLKLLTIFGAGLLVGTALAIIIPEGINATYSNNSPPPDHTHTEDIAIEVAAPPVDSNVVRKLRQLADPKDLPAVAKAPSEETHQVHEHHEDHGHQHEDSEGHQHQSEHKSIGVSLVAGFVFMLVIDQLGGGHSHGPDSESQSNGTHNHSRNKITATLGLCVHAAADGIALGAATSVSQTGLTIVVFVAIMLHKAPAAFGLVSFLLHDGLDRGRIRKHLLLFSAAAPIGAIVTFAILNHQSKEALAYYNATGIAMLFSAGTFLYVATVHILPEVSSKSSRTISSDGTVVIREHKGFTKLELLAIIIGSLLPVGISLSHGHSH